jgi:hypothetical protein
MLGKSAMGCNPTAHGGKTRNWVCWTLSVDAVATALTSRHAIRLQPSAGYAANFLGLSCQVPMKGGFLTDGADRKVQVVLKRTSPSN